MKKLKFKLFLLLTVIFSILLINAVYAENVTDEKNFKEIQNLIDYAKAGDSIVLDNKVYVGNGSSIKINKDITIYGSPTLKTTLNAKNISNIFVISNNINVNLIGLTFINANTTSEGSTIYNSGKLSIYNSTFINNHAGAGTIYNTHTGDLTVTNSIFDKNYAETGGAINTNYGKITIINSIFTNNYAIDGGAIYSTNATFAVYNSTFINNSGAMGGGIYNNKGKLKIFNSIFYSNNVTNQGGGIKSSGNCEIYNCIVKNNSANQGGGIYVNQTPLEITYSQINNNKASDGGAIYNTGTIYCSNSNINSNNVTNFAGAIYNSNNLTLLSSQINKNKSPHSGGAIYNTGNIRMDNLSFSENNGLLGGCIYTSNGFISVQNSLFVENNAYQAAVIYSSSDLMIDNSEFIKNTITHKAGVLKIVEGDVNITNSLFYLNTGADEGGCIFNLEYVKMNIFNTKFISNKAKSYGAAIDNAGELTINNCLFYNHDAYGAGAIDNEGRLIIIKSNFTNNKASKNGGAIDNKGNMTVRGTIFENNIAGGDGGAVIARRTTIISHSIFYNNHDSNGYTIFNKTLDHISFSNNWWGLNIPDFKKIININLTDDFKWIIMDINNISKLIQGKSASLHFSFTHLLNKNNSIFQLKNPELLPTFTVSITDTNTLTVNNGSLLISINVPSADNLIVKTHDQSFSFNIINPANIIKSKNSIVDYNGKFIFKVRFLYENGNPVGKGKIVYMNVSGKIYKVKTDKNGYALKKFKFKPGKYSIITIFNEYNVKNNIVIKNVLKAKNKSFKNTKRLKYSVCLKTSSGKAIKGKKIIFKIKNKVYKTKSNKNGIASVNLKNLKTGKYKIIIKYLDYSVKKLLKIKAL